MNIVLYPDGHVNGRVVELLALYMDQVQLCLPGKMEIDPWVKPFFDKGIINILKTTRPCPDNIDKALSDYTRWAEEHFSRSNGLKSLSRFSFGDDEETRSSIEKGLRESMKGAQSGQVTAKDWSSHALMHMAKRRDMEEQEAREFLLKAESAGKSLTDIMGVDDALWETAPNVTIRPEGMDDFLIAQRIRAWAYLFKERIPRNSALLTANAAAWDFVAEMCANFAERFFSQESGGTLETQPPGFSLDPLLLQTFEFSSPAEVLEARDGRFSEIRTQTQELLKEVSSREGAGSELNELNEMVEEINRKIADLGAQTGGSESAAGSARLIIHKASYAFLEDVLDELSDGKPTDEPAKGTGEQELMNILLDTRHIP